MLRALCARPTLSVILPRGIHPFPSRTRKLSPAGPMVLHAKVCGSVGRRRHKNKGHSEKSEWPFSLVTEHPESYNLQMLLFRKPAKASKSMLVFAIVLAIGLTIQFIQGVLRDFYANGDHPNFLTLPLYWLIWNLLPLTLFGIGKLLQKQGR
jgi:hypothetical protein